MKIDLGVAGVITGTLSLLIHLYKTVREYISDRPNLVFSEELMHKQFGGSKSGTITEMRGWLDILIINKSSKTNSVISFAGQLRCKNPELNDASIQPGAETTRLPLIIEGHSSSRFRIQLELKNIKNEMVENKYFVYLVFKDQNDNKYTITTSFLPPKF